MIENYIFSPLFKNCDKKVLKKKYFAVAFRSVHSRWFNGDH